MQKMKLNKKLIESFLLSFLITALVASVSRLFTRPDSAWYLALNKPAIQPPAIVFSIAWSIIYLLIAVALGLTIYSSQPNKKKTYIFFALQGVLNILWSLVFFVCQLPILSFVLIIAYLVIIYLTMREAYRLNKWAAYLQIPYLLWLLYAAALNYLIVLLN